MSKRRSEESDVVDDDEVLDRDPDEGLDGDGDEHDDERDGDERDDAGHDDDSPRRWTRWVTLALAAGVAGGLVGGFFVGLGALDRSIPPLRNLRRNARRTLLPAAPRRPQTPAYIPIAPWNPRKGPAHAKVTLVELSDFQ
jgi:hypothetical protein